MKQRLISLLVLLLFIHACFAGAHIENKKRLPTQNTYLFIETADSGSLKKNPDNESYTLTLIGVDPFITYFSNVPQRVTGIYSVKNFSELMDKEIKESHPKGLNAGIVIVDHKNKQTRRYMLSLANPKYDLVKDTATFKAYPLSGTHKNPLPDSENFEYVAVFIDNITICVSCIDPF